MKKLRLRSVIALLLAVVMMLSQSGFTVLATETAADPAANVLSEDRVGDEAAAESTTENKSEQTTQAATEATPEITSTTSTETTTESTTAAENTTVTTKASTVTTTAAETSSTTTSETTTESTTAGISAQLDDGNGGTDVPVSNNLNDFVTAVSVTGGSTDSNGNLVLYTGVTYQFTITFAENKSLQFNDNADSFVYTFDTSLTPLAVQGRAMTIEGKDSDDNSYTVDATYSISGSQAVITLDKESESYEKLKLSSNAHMYLELSATVNSEPSSENVFWSKVVDKKVQIKSTATLGVEKAGTYNEKAGTFEYTVKVTAAGIPTNVKVTDAITGTMVTFDKITSVTSSKSGRTFDKLTPDSSTDKGFTYTIGSMDNGEVVTIKYTGKVDKTGTTQNEKFDAAKTQNTVTVSADGAANATAGYSFTSKIYNYTMDKSLSSSQTSADNKVTLNYVVKVNSTPYHAVGGTTVTDTLKEDTGSVPRYYTGTGIKVERYAYNESGSLAKVDDYTVAWNEDSTNGKLVLNNQKDGTNSSWTYTLPADDAAYMYLISYTAEADASEIITSKTVKNTASWISMNMSKETSKTIGPGTGNGLGISKTHDSGFTKDRVDYTITVTIPKSGVQKKLVVRDDLPIVEVSGVRYMDTLIDDSISVTLDGEPVDQSLYTVDVNSYRRVIEVTFDAENNEAVKKLLAASGSSRTLVVKLVSDPDDDWPANYNNNKHTNTASVTLDGSSLSATDEISILMSDTALEKSVTSVGMENGLPVFYYKIFLVNPTQDTGTLTDTFDTELFELTDAKIARGKSKDYASYNVEHNVNLNSITNSGVEQKTVTLTYELEHMSGTTLFPYYCITYKLKVKDAAAYKALVQKAADNGGSYAVTNEAEWNGLTASTETAYALEPLTKKLAQAAASSNGYIASYSLTVNENGATLNGGNSMTLTDKLSSTLRLLEDTLVVKVNGTETKADYSYANNLLTIYVPDQAKVEISYDTQVVGENSVTYSNSATLMGSYTKAAETETVAVTSSGGGTASQYSIKIRKVDSVNRGIGVAEAVFSLYEKNAAGTFTQVISRTTGEPVSMTTDENGDAAFAGSYVADGWDLEQGKTYQLQETTTPEGYETCAPVTFTIVPKGGITGNDMYTTGQTITIADEWKTGNLTVSKKLAGNDTDKDKSFTFTIKLGERNGTKVNGTYSAVKFTDGVGTLKLKGGESYTIQGLPHGVTYTVTEDDYTADGYTSEVTYPETGNTIPENSTASVTVTNTRDTYGNLTVKKVVAGNGGDRTKEFKFKVELSDKTITGTYGQMEFTNGVANFKLADGETKKAEKLPTGVTYTVSEEDYENVGYETASTYKTGKIYNNCDIISTFTNTRDVGSLTIKKVLDGNATDSTKDFTFTITLKGGCSDAEKNASYSGVKFTDGVATITLKGGQEKEINGLPDGASYTVTEADYTSEGYTTTTEGTPTGTINKDKARVVTFTNTRNTYGNLTVTKEVYGNGGDMTKEFEFTVTLDDTDINATYGEMTFTNGVAKFSLKSGDSKTAVNLPNGVGYKVEEADYSHVGYIKEYDSYQSGKIIGDTTIMTTVKNTREVGSLTVRKALEGNDIDKTKEFTFTITLSGCSTAQMNDTYASSWNNGAAPDVKFTDGVATITLKGGELRTIEGLPDGAGYKVEEADYSKDGYTATWTGEPTGKIDSERGLVAACTNTRNTYGNLTVSKIVAGSDGDPEKTFKFTVTLSDKITGKYGDLVFENGKAQFELKGGESKTAENLPNGAHYEVQEADYSEVGYVKKYDAYQTGTIVGNKTISTTVTNTREVGTLTVRKALAGNDTDSTKDFTFYIALSNCTESQANHTYAAEGADASVKFTGGKAEITLKGGESLTIKDLPEGVSYQVSEADYSEEGYVTTWTGTPNGTIDTEKGRVVAYTNTRNTYGNLTVTKAVNGNGGDLSKSFRFTVTLSDKTISQDFGGMIFENGVAQFELKNGESRTATGLPNGVHYTVEEGDYSHVGYVKHYDENAAGIISEDCDIHTTVTNTREVGSLTVRKALAGNDTESDKEFTFTVTLSGSDDMTLSETQLNDTYSGVQFTNGVGTFTLKGGETKMIEGLPDGAHYTVAEANYSADGYEATWGGDPTGTIDDAKGRVAVCTNTRNTYGDLTVKKLVAGNGGSASKEFSFTVTLSDSTITGLYGNLMFENGVAQFTLKHGESKTAENLPNGVTYTVTEADYSGDGYTTETSGDVTGMISEDCSREAVFTNTREVPETPVVVTPTVTPTAAPSVTPTVTPSVTPTATPEVTPTITPEVTPSENPEVTPTENPETEPSVTPTATPTPGLNLTVTKTLNLVDGTRLDAVNETYYVALYADEACTQRISEVQALHFQDSSLAAVQFGNLESGKKYYISECSADGTASVSGTTDDGVSYASSSYNKFVSN